jgi:hypothetical protein
MNVISPVLKTLPGLFLDSMPPVKPPTGLADQVSVPEIDNMSPYYWMVRQKYDIFNVN